MREHRLDGPAVLALQAVVLLEPLLHLLEASGLGLERLAVAAQLGTQLVGLDPQRAHPLGERVELRVRARHAVGEPLGLGQRGRGAHSVGVAGRERLRPRPGGGAERVEAAQAPPLDREPFLLLDRRLQGVDLLELVGEQVAVAVARAGAGPQRVELAAQPADARVRGGEALALGQVAGAAEAVEDLELRGGQHELAVLVLAVEGEQPPAELAQVAGARRAPLDERARAPLGAHAAPSTISSSGSSGSRSRRSASSSPSNSPGAAANTPST